MAWTTATLPQRNESSTSVETRPGLPVDVNAGAAPRTRRVYLNGEWR